MTILIIWLILGLMALSRAVYLCVVYGGEITVGDCIFFVPILLGGPISLFFAIQAAYEEGDFDGIWNFVVWKKKSPTPPQNP